MDENFITNKKAAILFRYMTCVVECPYCGEELIFDMTENIGYQLTEIFCPECEQTSSVGSFDYLAQSN